jgi:hypothetical protein
VSNKPSSICLSPICTSARVNSIWDVTPNRRAYARDGLLLKLACSILCRNASNTQRAATRLFHFWLSRQMPDLAFLADSLPGGDEVKSAFLLRRAAVGFCFPSVTLIRGMKFIVFAAVAIKDAATSPAIKWRLIPPERAWCASSAEALLP